MPPRAQPDHTDAAPPATPAGLFCVSCDYDLRGLHPDGNCPECGTPVARSIVSRHHWRLTPARRLRLRLGLTLEILPLLALLILFWHDLPWPMPPVPRWFSAGTGAIALVIAIAFWCAAGLLIPLPPPTDRPPRPGPLLRHVAVALLPVCAPLMLLMLAFSSSGISRRAALSFITVGLVFQAAREVLIGRRLVALARRFHSPTLAALTLISAVLMSAAILASATLFASRIPDPFDEWIPAAWLFTRTAWSVVCLRLLIATRQTH